MRGRVRSQDLKVLLVSPSSHYLSIHRKSIKDCQFLRDIGGNPMLYCLKDSYIDKEALKNVLPQILLRGGSHSKLFGLQYFLDIRRVLNEEDWDIVHCYGMWPLWSVALWLYGKSKVSLFVTINSKVPEKRKLSLRFYLMKLLFKRVDTVFCFAEPLVEQIKINFDLRPKKVKAIGLGVDNLCTSNLTSDLNLPADKARSIKLGSFVDKELDFDNLKALISALSTFDSNFESNKIELIVYTVKPIKDFYFYSSLSRFIESEKVSIKFLESAKSLSIYSEIDIFVNLSSLEVICDYEIKSLLKKIPVISPRTASRAELLLKYPKALKTYTDKDAREIRLCISNYLESFEKQKEALSTLEENILREHSLESYAQQLQTSYEWMSASRERLDGARRKK